MTTRVRVRALEPSDLDAVVAIDEKLTGQTRKDYWRTRFGGDRLFWLEIYNCQRESTLMFYLPRIPASLTASVGVKVERTRRRI